MNILQYILYISIIITSIIVITALNPVTSIFNLILTFCLSTCLFLSIGAEFLGFVFLMVYVGAIAILFLFVVMMLDIKVLDLRESYLQYLPIGFLILAFFIYELVCILNPVQKFLNVNVNLSNTITELYYIDWSQRLYSISNVELIGSLVYTDYLDLFVIASIILLVAMIGAIVLTLRKNEKPFSRKQDLNSQVFRDFEETVKKVLYTKQS